MATVGKGVAAKGAVATTAAKTAVTRKRAAKKSVVAGAIKKQIPSHSASLRANDKQKGKGNSNSSGSGKGGRKGEDEYTDPELRERIKREVMAGDKGGRPGQWSARKAQLVAHEYVAAGGGYKHPPNEAQESLKHWGEENWHTATGEKAVQGEETHRYLPDAAWKELSPEERKATEAKKVKGSRTGKQFVANTPAASRARRHAEGK